VTEISALFILMFSLKTLLTFEVVIIQSISFLNLVMK